MTYQTHTQEHDNRAVDNLQLRTLLTKAEQPKKLLLTARPIDVWAVVAYMAGAFALETSARVAAVCRCALTTKVAMTAALKASEVVAVTWGSIAIEAGRGTAGALHTTGRLSTNSRLNFSNFD